MAKGPGIWAAYYMGAIVSLMVGALMRVQDKLNNPFNTCGFLFKPPTLNLTPVLSSPLRLTALGGSATPPHPPLHTHIPTAPLPLS